jgi:hypothetical protein
MKMSLVGERVFKCLGARKGRLYVQGRITGDHPETIGNADKKYKKDGESSINRHCVYFWKIICCI